MPIDYFLYGLTSFSMGLIVLLRGSRRSQLALGHNFYWLSAFGFSMSGYAWGCMFYRATPSLMLDGAVTGLLSILLALSGLVLIRFGIGLIATAGPLPSWLQFLPITLLVPVVFIIAYAIIAVETSANQAISAEQWTRYLFLFPGNVLAAIGFRQQWQRVKQTRIVLAATALAFLMNAFFTGIVTSAVGLSDTFMETVSHIPIGYWRVGSLALVALLVSRSMNIFKIERQQELARLQIARAEAEQAAQTIHAQSQQESELWLNALVKVSQRIAAMDDAEAILADVVRLARELVHGDTAALALYEHDARLYYKYQADSGGVQSFQAVPVDDAVILHMAETGHVPRDLESGETAPFTWTIGQHEYRTQATIIAALQLSQRTIGVFWAGRFDNRPFSSSDAVRLTHLADQLVIVLEHAAMAGRLQSLAVLEERARIAREMHDSLAQILGYLGLETQTLEALTRQHDETAVLSELAQARSLIKSAQANVRENILSLRTTLADGVGFLTALKQYIEEFGIQTGIHTTIVADEEFELSPLTQTQAVRIVQEALTNARKHAQAAQICVTLNREEDCLTICIRDDGIGISDMGKLNGHFGLQTMRERAESVGGSLCILSSPGCGTQINVRLPLA